MDNSGWKAPTAIAVLLACISLGLWSLSLDQRPLHNDEAVNGIKFSQLWEHGGYKYDPNEHHGPSLYYATLALGRLMGAPADADHFSERRLRFTTVLFGVGLILLLPLVADGLGRKATGWAALFTAVSPAVVFYSRYYIHEVLLVFFTFLALAAGWRYWRSRKLGWALLAGAGLGLMHATKETFVITLAVAAIALGLSQLWNRWVDAAAAPAAPRRLNRMHLAAALAVWIGVALVLFSSFFTNAAGPAGFGANLPALAASRRRRFTAYPFLALLPAPARVVPRRQGPGVERGFHSRAGRHGRVGGFRPQRARRRQRQLRTVPGALQLWFGSRICPDRLQDTVVPAEFLARHDPAGGRWSRLVAWTCRTTLAADCLGTVAAGRGWSSGWQALLANTTYAADPRNPYDYAQTSPDLLNLVDKVEGIARVDPQGTNMLVEVIAPESDYWPLPWYLRNLKRIGWWDQLPADPYAPVMIVSAQLRAALDEKQTHVMVGYFQLRPQVFLELYVELNLWKAYLAKNPPKAD